MEYIKLYIKAIKHIYYRVNKDINLFFFFTNERSTEYSLAFFLNVGYLKLCISLSALLPPNPITNYLKMFLYIFIKKYYRLLNHQIIAFIKIMELF